MIEEVREESCDCVCCRIISRTKSSEAFQHLRNARREVLLAFKSIIEGCIERIDEKNTSAQKPKAQKIEIS